MAPEHARRPQILIVDDDDDVREILVLLLTDEGFDVSTAENGAQALALLEAGDRPAAIILDLMMPVLSGWDFWDRAQEHPSYRHIPIIVMTATGLTDGCIGHARVLPKPVGRDELLAVVHAACVQPTTAMN